MFIVNRIIFKVNNFYKILSFFLYDCKNLNRFEILFFDFGVLNFFLFFVIMSVFFWWFKVIYR